MTRYALSLEMGKPVPTQPPTPHAPSLNFLVERRENSGLEQEGESLSISVYEIFSYIGLENSVNTCKSQQLVIVLFHNSPFYITIIM